MTTSTLASATVTEGIRIEANASFMPEESDVKNDKFVFGYRITIVNEGDEAARLLTRHWVIIDADGHREEVRGPGVVDKTPRIEPGETFEYTSYSVIATEWGTMEGEYQMTRDDGTTFDARIGRFYLTRKA